MKFYNKEQITLMNGGYLSDPEGNPVTNKKFIKAQRAASYVITLAELAEGKTFKAKEADSLEELFAAVKERMEAIPTVEFVKIGKAPEQPLTKQLKDEALAFIAHKDGEVITKKINDYLQKFVILQQFEEHGLFFTPAETPIRFQKKIYSMAEVIEATTKVIDLL